MEKLNTLKWKRSASGFHTYIYADVPPDNSLKLLLTRFNTKGNYLRKGINSGAEWEIFLLGPGSRRRVGLIHGLDAAKHYAQRQVDSLVL